MSKQLDTEVEYIPAEVLADQYELDLAFEGILPDAPLEDLPCGEYPRIQLRASEGDHTATVLLQAIEMDLSRGLPEGYEEIEALLMEE